jgi:hypothetical protein
VLSGAVHNLHSHGWIPPDLLPASGLTVSFALPPHPELVLLCGGTQQQRAKLRRTHSAKIDSQAAVTTGDVQSLLRWAPRSRAVIVCGELAGIGAATIERLVRERAPDVEVIGEDRSPEPVVLPRPAAYGRPALRVAS